ncbi:nucleoside recognition domain-containing protein [Paenibacillus sp. FSL R7-277]|uniref:nucleoside recognition domain-containing protein n=1 Tax=Paenibacillus sp. FSL R7-277 TaxID=1227352 RepID=UPI0003E1D3E0|nr:nucleoside recognition domain-containing protein [Paenibacillus sp. FSL R7-277]ETT63178.1 nucleoside recognition domain-containing protein [Paenibacillus sp. FSL R7-277]
MINFRSRRFLSGSAPFIPGAAAILLAIAIIIAPEASFKASLTGLTLWWTLVFPALLPFLILSEMLSASGFVHGIGVLLEPLMKRCFRLPGAGGWTLVLGLTAGFPAGAGGVMQLHKQGDITDKEAGRLAAIVHYASPVTLLIVVGTAFLHSPAAGYALLAIHWLSGIAAGILSACFNGSRKITSPIPLPQVPQERDSSLTGSRPRSKKASLPRRIHQAAADARSRDGRGFGKVLGESVSSAVQSLMIVGGYMIMFAVVVSIVTRLFPQLPALVTASMLEIHLGARSMTSATAGLEGFVIGGLLGPALLSAGLAWSGICAQLQALTVLKAANVRFLPFTVVRLLHGLFAFAFTLLLWTPLLHIQSAVLPVLAGSPPAVQLQDIGTSLRIWTLAPQILGLMALLVTLLLLLSAAVKLFTSNRRPSG